MERITSDTNTNEGLPKEKGNYRPVSWLIVASKVLEKIICDRVTNFMEKNKLLPKTSMVSEQKCQPVLPSDHMQT
jgi:hypothetical protein